MTHKLDELERLARADCEHENLMYEPSGRLICELCRGAIYPQPKPYKDDADAFNRDTQSSGL